MAVYEAETIQDVAAILPENFHSQLRKVLAQGFL
jgi:hypothetical protein